MHTLHFPTRCDDGSRQPAQGREEREDMHIPWRNLISDIHHPLPYPLHADELGLEPHGRSGIRPCCGRDIISTDLNRLGICMSQAIRSACTQVVDRELAQEIESLKVRKREVTGQEIQHHCPDREAE